MPLNHLQKYLTVRISIQINSLNQIFLFIIVLCSLSINSNLINNTDSNRAGNTARLKQKLIIQRFKNSIMKFLDISEASRWEDIISRHRKASAKFSKAAKKLDDQNYKGVRTKFVQQPLLGKSVKGEASGKVRRNIPWSLLVLHHFLSSQLHTCRWQELLLHGTDHENYL